MNKRVAILAILTAWILGVFVGIGLLLVYPTGEPIRSVPSGRWDVINIQTEFEPVTGEPIYYVTASPMREVVFDGTKGYESVGGPRFLMIPGQAVPDRPKREGNLVADRFIMTLTIDGDPWRGGTARFEEGLRAEF